MIWVLVIAIAVACVGLAFWLFRLTGQAAMMFGAMLAVGLALYSLQGRPGLVGAPQPAAEKNGEEGSALVEMRQRVMQSQDGMRSRHLVTADAFARRGQFEQAAAFLRGAIEENPKDTEAWVALGNALVEHAGGRLTPPALLAYTKAREANPNSLAPDFFIGITLIGQGRLGETQELWHAALARVPENSPFRAEFNESLTRLDELARRVAEMQEGSQPTQTAEPTATPTP